MSLRDIEITGAPPLQCRAVFSSVTIAHIAGLPFKLNDEINPVRLQTLDTRVPKHFGKVPFLVLEPDLVPHPSGFLVFPKVERMAFLLAETTSEALVLVWFEPDDTVFMSEANSTKFKELNWKDHAGPVEMKKSDTTRVATVHV